MYMTTVDWTEIGIHSLPVVVTGDGATPNNATFEYPEVHISKSTDTGADP